MDPFVGQWYGMWSPPKDTTDSDSVAAWDQKSASANTTFNRLVRASKRKSLPSSLPLSQEYLRVWEDQARKASHIGNQAAGLTRCLGEV